ncbi:MAG: hypothetical protein Fur005_39960 [Roseiflexaceae bacterium]
MLPNNAILQNRYQIVAQIGRGGMGAVYKAIDTRLRNTVALKQTLVEGEAARRAFEREAQLLASMRHPALPKVIDHFTEEDGQFLVMEFISGDDLATLLHKNDKPFQTTEVLSWADRLLDALEYLHSHTPPIVHRDIKPQNMKLTDRGEIILLDFGLAKGATSARATRATSTGSIYGYTPHYAPLEQIQGTGTSIRSDLYALAATIYHLLTGSPPPDALARAAARINEEPDPLLPANQINPEVPAAVARAIEIAMAQKPDQRPEHAAAMRRMLRDAARQVSTATIVFPTGERVSPSAATDATVSSNLATHAIESARPATQELPTVSGQVSMGTTIVEPNQATTPTQPTAEPRRRPAWVVPAITAVVVGVLAAVVTLGLSSARAVPPALTAVAITSITGVATDVAGVATATAAPTIDPIQEARATVFAEQTATTEAALTQTAVIVQAIENTDATRTAIAQATIDSASNVEQTALAETAAVLALTPTETIVPPSATPDPNRPTNTPRPTNTRGPTATPAPTTAPTAVAGKAEILAQGGGNEFRGSASVGTIDPAQSDGGSCIQGSLKAADGGLFPSFIVGIDQAGSVRNPRYNYNIGFFGLCGLGAGEWGITVYNAGGKDTSPADQGQHQVRVRLSGTPGEVVYVNFRAVNFEAPQPTPTLEASPYDGVWGGTIRGTTSNGSKSFTGNFRMEVRNGAVYRVSVDGADCFFDTYPNYPNGVKINNNGFGFGGNVFNPVDNSKADISHQVNGIFNSPTSASGVMRATQNGGVCIEGQWSIGR